MNLDTAREVVLSEMTRMIVMSDGDRALLAMAWQEFQQLVEDTGKIDESFIRAALKRARRRQDAEAKAEG